MKVTIVGGGPAGLAAAGALKQRGIQSTVLEQGDKVGTSWRGHYERLHLHTIRRLSGLPGHPIPTEMGKWVARDDLVRYLEDYAAKFDLEIRPGIGVQRIDPDERGWLVRTASGDHPTDKVVMATGYNRTPVLPDWPGKDRYEGELIHSAQYRNAAPYRGKRVLVVGSGNSGAEIAVDLVEGGAREVLVSIRTPPNIQRREFLGIATQQVGILAEKLPVKLADRISLALQKLAIGDLRPYGLDPPKTGALSRIYEDAQIPLIDVGFLDALKQRRLTVVPAVDGFESRQIHLSGGTQLEVDAVIAATGYSRGLEPLVGHLGILNGDGTPVPSGRETSPIAPGIYFIGYRNAPGGLLRRIRMEAEAMADTVSQAIAPAA
jgi:putative flavoprotein involved in K+ transport